MPKNENRRAAVRADEDHGGELNSIAADTDRLILEYYEHRFDYHAYTQRRLRHELEARQEAAARA